MSIKGLARPLAVLACILFAHTADALSLEELNQRLEGFQLPPGFEISVYATDVPNARQMALGKKGTIFVGSMGVGKVHAVVDEDNDFKADKVIEILSAENLLSDGAKIMRPVGVAFHKGDLYVSSISHVLKLKGIEKNLDNPGAPVIVTSDYPDTVMHGWKYLGVGPDNKLYLSVGAWCNVCDEDDELFGSITRIKTDGSGREIIAKGIRNTVGFDFHPKTGELWFTENGSEHLGDDAPADELNRLATPGQHFGFPYFHGGDIADPEFGKGKSADDYTKPAMKLGPHVAALGMGFYTGKMFPEEYRNQVIIAEHGSGDVARGRGYRLTVVRLDGNDATHYEEFVTGWLQDGKAWGRPNDVLVMEDGSLLVSDDRANAIFRITYTK